MDNRAQHKWLCVQLKITLQTPNSMEILHPLGFACLPARQGVCDLPARSRRGIF